jgi:serine/threonine protein kinase/tetratricopeptide (TPR) repeat protein
MSGPPEPSPQPHSEDTIVDGALELPPEERPAFLDKACGADSRLRELVEGMLRAHERISAPRPRLAGTIQVRPDSAGVPTEKPGERIGAYKILQQIGEGGCGVVYMAEQEQPVRRRVALKVIKLGMDTKQVIARFEAERQALALMDHPNIAKVLDAGATDTGRPFFVMELVRGIKITDYCDQNNISTRKRLGLFMQVCGAIQHAHQKGIIHRDIKPSNVLVTLHDGLAVPKVIDFGIAKAATGQPLTDKTVFTAFEQFIGTPAYMSPEQAEMSGLDIDTRSDIYALGVLLYELLTGKTPFDAKRLVSAALDELRRIIREEDPPRPSTRISTLDAAERTTVAKRRQADAPKLVHLVRGDLDWIVMRCLEKDRSRRYETANGLAQDVQRFLDDEPVVARPPSHLYRFQKLVRRNKFAFGAAALVILSLLFGLGLSTWLFFKEKRARQFADLMTRRFDGVSEQLEDTLTSISTEALALRDRAHFASAEASLRAILGVRQKVFGDWSTNVATTRNNLGLVLRSQGKLAEAENQHRQALGIATNVLGRENMLVAVSLNGLALALHEEGKLAEAETNFQQALKLFEEFRGRGHPGVGVALDNLASVLRDEDQPRRAEELENRAITVLTNSSGSIDRNVATALSNLGLIKLKQGELAKAYALEDEALKMRNALLGPEHPEIANSLENLALTLRAQAEYARTNEPTGHGSSGEGNFESRAKLKEAERLESQALVMREKLLGPENLWVAKAHNRLGKILSDEGQFEKAEDDFHRAFDMARRTVGDEHRLVPAFFEDLVKCLARQGKRDEIEKVANELLTPELGKTEQGARMLKARDTALAEVGKEKLPL